MGGSWDSQGTGFENVRRLKKGVLYFTFIFIALSRHFYPKRLALSTMVRRRETIISCGTVRMFIEPESSAKH